MTPTICLRGVDKRYADRHALSTIDLDVAPGEFVTLFGPSGCGKSTLLRVMAGLIEPTSGRATLLGAAPRAAAQRKAIGWVPQSAALLPWLTVRQNATLSRCINQAAGNPATDADAVLAELGLTAHANARPAALSGGLRQRAAIARAFVQGAPVLLMDEPFSALDDLSRESARTQLLRLWRSQAKTVVFVTHAAEEAVLLSDRVVVMTPSPGRIHSILPIDLPRPRLPPMMATAAFTALVDVLRQRLRGIDA